MNGKLNLLSTTGERTSVDVKLNPHLLRKMGQAQRNFKIATWGHRGYKTRGYNARRSKYWARQFNKWCQLLIERPI